MRMVSTLYSFQIVIVVSMVWRIIHAVIQISCGSTINLNPSSALTYRFGDGINPYQTLLNCDISFSLSDASEQILIQIFPDCAQDADVLKINDGANLCCFGCNRPSSALISSFQVSLTTDSTTDPKELGFEIKIVTGKDESNCTASNPSSNISVSVGASPVIITSPNFPNQYPKNRDCSYIITPQDPSKGLSLTFDVISLDYDRKCYDYIELGIYNKEPYISICTNYKGGLFLTNESYTSGGETYLHFHSDISYVGNGFRVRIIQVDLGATQPPTAASTTAVQTVETTTSETTAASTTAAQTAETTTPSATVGTTAETTVKLTTSETTPTSETTAVPATVQSVSSTITASTAESTAVESTATPHTDPTTKTQQQLLRLPSVSLLQDVYYVFPETNLTISVNVSFPLTEAYMVTWKHKEKNSDLARDINNRELFFKYTGGSLGQPSLTIKNVTDFDAGEYFIEIKQIDSADPGSTAGPATVYVLSKKSKEYYTASAEVCPPNWQTFYEIGSDFKRKRCVQKVEQSASFYQAQTICRQQRAYLVPVVIRLSADGNETDPFAYLPRTDVWTGGYEEYGSLVLDGAPPIYPDISVLSYGRGFNISDAWTDGNPFCIGFNNLYQELQIRDCNERLPFLCNKEADILSFKPNLNICPSEWIGAEDVDSCYLLTKDPKQPLDAIEVCNQNGGTLLQLQLVKDQQLALRLLVHLALVNSSVWFSDVESPVSCSVIRLRESMEIYKTTNCDIAANVVCQTNKRDRMYSSSELQIEYQQPKLNTNGGGLDGNLTCKFPAPHLETDTYSVYKGGAILDRLNVFKTNYSRAIMKWNPKLSDEESFLSSASTDSEVYRCDIQRKGVGLVLSKTIYAIPNDKRVSIFHATVSMKGNISLPDALMETYMSSSIQESLLEQLRGEIRSKIFSVSSDIRPVSGGRLGFIRVTTIPLRKRNALNFLLFFVGPNEEWKSAEAMNYLLNNITISARTRPIETRRRRRQIPSLSVDFKTFEIRNEEYCTVEYSPDFQYTYNFVPVGNGSMTYSEELCITDFEPLLSGLCYTRTAAPAKIRNVTVNPNCQFLLNPSFANMTSLKKLSKVPTNNSNVEIVASDLANLTRSSLDLTVEDVVYTSMVLESIASISSISEQTTGSVLQTLSNILEAPAEILMNAHNLGSSTTRILQSVETVTRKVVLNGTEYRNFQKSFAVAVTDVTSGVSPGIGIQLKNMGIDVVLDNKTIGLINAEDSTNITSFDTAIILPKDLVQGNNSRVIFIIFENTKIFQVRQMNRRYELNGKVASATLISNGKPVFDLGGNFVRSIYKPLNMTENSVCGFWNHSLYATSGGWSTKGCQRTDAEDGLVVCECDHLTNFAILLDVKGQSDVIDKDNTLALSIITIIGLSLSIVGLGLTVLSFILFKQLRKGRGQQTLFNLALALLCSIVIFLAGMERTESYYGCITVAALMHYFLLVSFMWMLVEGFLQYLRCVRVLGTYVPRFMLKASIPAWGLPLIPVVTVLAVDYDLYRGGNYYCWMSPTPFYYAFLLPVAMIIIVNCIVFALVLKNLLNRPKGLQSNQSESKQAMMNLRAAVSIFILLGLTWIFGILAIEDARIVFSYIFTILTTFQGFFIFILFVAREKQFRSYWGKLCCKRFTDRQKKYKPTSASHSSSQPLSKLGSHETASTEIFLSSK